MSDPTMTRIWRLQITWIAIALLIVVPGSGRLSTVRAQNDPNAAIAKQEKELERQRVELEKKTLELQRKELELEKARQQFEAEQSRRSLSMNLSGGGLL